MDSSSSSPSVSSTGSTTGGALTFLPDILADLPLFGSVVLFNRSFEVSQYVYSGLLLLGSVGQYAGGKLVDRIGVEYALIGGFFALSTIGLAFIPSAAAGLGPLLIAGGFLGFVVFMIAPINQVAISKYSSTDARGLSFGYSYAAIFGVGAFGASLAGVVLTRSTPGILFAVLAGIASMASLTAAYLAWTSS